MNKKTAGIIAEILMVIFLVGISIDIAFHFLLWGWI